MSGEIVSPDLVYELKGVEKVHPLGDTEVRALDGVDLRVERGECLAIVGRSGSGKSSLLHLLGLLDVPTAGSVRFLGDDPASMSDRTLSRLRGRSIGFVFQEFRLLEDETALGNVCLPLRYAGVRDADQRAHAALERVGLGHRVGHRPRELSGGERQRVAIARAIVKQPQVVLADEPTGNLDTASGDAVTELLLDVWKAGGTLVFVTHDAALAALCPRVIHMEDGRIASGE